MTDPTARTVFVTGSTAGIGLETARQLAEAGHRVVVHARNPERAEQSLPEAAAVVVGDLGSLDETVAMAESARAHGPYDAVVHNAGIYDSRTRVVTGDGLERTFQVNVLAPYVLTALIPVPERLIYLTSGMSSGGRIELDDLQRVRRPWTSTGAYQDSKLCDIALALAMARRYPATTSTAVCPGWVQTRMGGWGAPTDVATGAATQVWLAVSDDPAALVNGRYLRHMRELPIPGAAGDLALQDGLIDACGRLSGVVLPV